MDVLLDLRVSTIIVVGILYLGAAWAVIDPGRAARSIYHYYRSIPEGKWGPKWFRWQFRPTMKQATIISWCAVLLGISIGTWLLVADLV